MKELSEEARAKRNAYRRAYRLKNLEKCRRQNRESAERRKQRDPEKMKAYNKEYQAMYKERNKTKASGVIPLDAHPEHDKIMARIRAEEAGGGGE